MTKQLLLGCRLLFMLLASLSWLFWPSPPKHRINTEGYHRLRLGMTEKEVESSRCPRGRLWAGEGRNTGGWNLYDNKFLD
jgi:hypothetical protein